MKRFLLLAATATATAAGAAPASAGAETRRVEENFGSIEVIREDWRNEGAPQLHAPQAWTKVQLVWTSRDGRVRATLEDDGYVLASSYRVSGAGGQETCLGGGSFQAYRTGETALAAGRYWRRSFRPLAGFIRQCTAADRSRLAGYEAEYRAAEAHYIAASSRMLAVVQEAFPRRGLRRCIEMSGPESPLGPGECERWSPAAVERP